MGIYALINATNLQTSFDSFISLLYYVSLEKFFNNTSLTLFFVLIPGPNVNGTD